jgi:glycosyltransferase involved in cell wall biosynthesis
MNEKKKIVILGPAHPFRGGIAAFTDRMALAFVEAGYDVEVFTFTLQYPSFLFPGKSQFSDAKAPTAFKITRAFSSINPFSWIKLGWKIRMMRPEILIVKFWLPFMGPSLGTIARIVKGNHFTKIVANVDNIVPHEHNKSDRPLAQYFVNSVQGFIVMSRSVLEELMTFSVYKPHRFTPHPIYDHYGDAVPKSEALKLLGLDETVSYMMFFGFIRDYKGLDLLIKAAAEPKIRNLNLKFIVAGEFYSDPKPILQLVKEHDLEDKFIFINEFISDNEVYKYFCAADAVVQPYKSATQSGVTQIAYHFNKPMIITRVGGLQEFVPDGKVGYVVEPNSPSIADAIFKFYDEKKEDEFVANTAKEKLKFSWEVFVHELELLVKDCK